jgi:hypothetical protein
MPNDFEYELTIDLNALNHLGINLYSNIPAVLSEVVANSYDADADNVEVTLNIDDGTIVIWDDGHGMSQGECNKKFLTVGYRKRDHESVTTAKGRHVFGRKGIGKLSLFSIANIIEVHSIKIQNGGCPTKSAFTMNVSDIANTITSGVKNYKPTKVDEAHITITKGTRIALRELKKNISTATEGYLRKRLARRFSVIGENNFRVSVNGKDIAIEDRDFFPKIQYLWTIGDSGKKYSAFCTSLNKPVQHVDGIIDIDKGYEISGWIGTFDKQKNIDKGNNSITILAWGKLIHEDILKDIKEGGIFSKYLIGEIRADFLDYDNLPDMATSDRQRLVESDSRFERLRDYIQAEILKKIGSKWRDWRNEDSAKKAIENPKLNEWYSRLSADHKKYAHKLLGTIESLDIEDSEEKKEIYKHGIVAFETLAMQGNLGILDKIDTEKDYELLKAIIRDLEQLASFHHYQISKSHLEVLKKLENITPKAKERVIQEHIFKHLWLLDPTLDRAYSNEYMEKTVRIAFDELNANLSDEEKDGRVDIGYKTASGKHIVIELKKYDRTVKATELIEQSYKYQTAIHKVFREKHPSFEPPNVETICLLGSPPSPKDDDDSNRKMLASKNIRYYTYDELIEWNRKSYQAYLDKENEMQKLTELIDSIDFS